MRAVVSSLDYDLVWLDTGAQISPSVLRMLKKGNIPVINYNHDDPFGSRDGRKWDLYRKCVKLYDLVVVVREENVREAREAGAKRILRVFRPYDPVAHHPKQRKEEDAHRFQRDVVFVGSWMPERGPFMKRLRELGVPLSIFGSSWEKAREYRDLCQVVNGPLYGDDYIRALQYSKVALGLLSRGNRDLHTQRSAEIPYVGGAAFCAMRTTEHEMLFKHGEHAMLWSSPEECADACFCLLNDELKRRRMVESAKRRIESLQLSNDRVIAAILSCFRGESVNHPLVFFGKT